MKRIFKIIFRLNHYVTPRRIKVTSLQPPEFDSYFSITKKLCALIGLQPFTFYDDDQNEISFWYNTLLGVFGIFMTLNQLLSIVCFTTFLVFKSQNLLEIVTQLPFLVFVVESIIRFGFLYFNRKTINDLLVEFRDLYRTSGCNDQPIIQELIAARHQLKLYQYAHVFCNAVFTYAPLLITLIFYTCFNMLSQPLFILNTWMPFDKFRYAWLTYVIEINVCRYAQYATVAVDSIIIASIIQLYFHFDWLNKVLSKAVDKNGVGNETAKNLRDVIEMHVKLTDLCSRFNETFTVQTFIKFGNASILICCIGFVAIISNDLLITIQFLMFLAANILQIFVLSLYGEILIDKSISIGKTAYDIEWYSCSVQNMKAIHLILLRSQKPCIMSILGVATVKRETFKEIITASYTYMSLLNKLYHN